MSLALLFPGQGVQAAGMLPWLECEPGAAPVLAILASHLGADWRSRLADDAWASSNQVAQPLMTGVALAVWGALESRLPGPSMVAGYSVGEVAAYSVAGLFDAATALELARRRAELMDTSNAAAPGGLLAVRGLTTQTVEQIGIRIGVSVAIDVGIDRCIVGGALSSLAAAERALRDAGAEVTPLRIRVASHTHAMAEAAAEFARVLDPDALAAEQVPGHLRSGWRRPPRRCTTEARLGRSDRPSGAVASLHDDAQRAPTSMRAGGRAGDDVGPHDGSVVPRRDDSFGGAIPQRASHRGLGSANLGDRLRRVTFNCRSVILRFVQPSSLAMNSSVVTIALA